MLGKGRCWGRVDVGGVDVGRVDIGRVDVGKEKCWKKKMRKMGCLGDFVANNAK